MKTSGMNRYNAISMVQAKLQRQVERHGLAVAELAKSVDDLNIRAKATDEPAQVISEAGGTARVSPSWPSNLALSVVLGIFLSALVAVLAEHLDDRLRSATDATQYLEAPVLAYVPLIENEDPRI